MTEITALYPELPSPHTGGYGVLYADGHASINRNINFPPFQRPSLASTIKTEKQNSCCKSWWRFSLQQERRGAVYI